MRVIDCSRYLRVLSGSLYAHEYDEVLLLFKELAHLVSPVVLTNIPSCWVPFVRYLGHDVRQIKIRFPDADRLDWNLAYNNATDKRRVVEIASGCRPELVHALYCADTEWRCPMVVHSRLKEFVVTGNASFFRNEVMSYRRVLRSYVPEKLKAVLVPCAADKPYPAPVHSAVIERLPEDWDIIVTTGVLGLVPRALWDEAPYYDSGLPNLDRVTQTVAWYFAKHRYAHIVVYSDFYAYAIREGLSRIDDDPYDATYIFGSNFRDTYENLLLMEHLDRLEAAILTST